MIKLPGASPRWIIFSIDLIVCLGAWTIALNYWLSLLQESISYNQTLYTYIPVVIVNVALFFATSLYSGIVRFTGSYELARILLISFSGTILIYIANEIFFSNVYSRFSLFWLSYFFSVSIGLATYRLFIKFGYRYISLQGLTTNNVVIYGAGIPGATVKAAIDRSADKNFIIRAFVDERPNYHYKRLDGIPVLSPEQFKSLHNKLKIEKLIVASILDNPKSKSDVLEFCITEGIDIQKVPESEILLGKNISLNQFPRLNIEELLGRPPIQLENNTTTASYRDKVILVTGAAGSIGSELCRQLLFCEPRALILCDQAETPLNDLILSLTAKNKKAELIPFLASVTDGVRMNHLFTKYKPNLLFHAAAYKHVPVMEAFPTEALRVNVSGTRLLADMSVRHGVNKFVMVSSDKAVNPTNVMGASKRLAEMYVQSLASEGNCPTKFITTRFGNVLGSNGSVINRFKAQIEKGGPVTVTHPEINRFFMTVSEACQLVLEAGNMGNGGEVFIFDMGEPVLIADLAKKMISLSGLVPNKEVKIEYCGLRPGEKLYEELLHNKEENTETYHEKIMIARVRVFPYEDLAISFDTLMNMLREGKEEIELVRWMKALVPEYVSNNSEFESLDHLSPTPDLINT
ncbi:MAG: polysaccharide biosynthesis protein [Saprospiraceae bacterium]